MPYREPATATAAAPTPEAPFNLRSRRMTYVMTLAPYLSGAVVILWLTTKLQVRALDPLLPMVAGWLIFTGAWLIVHRLRFRQGLLQLNESQALLNHGSYAAGAELCRRVLARHRMGGLPATALNNLSIAVYRQGDAPRALMMLKEIERAGWCRGPLGPMVMQNRAVYQAVLGDLPDAERCLREARLKMTAAHAEATLFAVDVMVAAHAGRFVDVVAMTGTSAASPRLQVKLLRVLRAWGLRITAPEASAAEVSSLLAGVRPVVPGELRYVTAHWAELRTFLIEEGLSEIT
jgi:hypothetical protein